MTIHNHCCVLVVMGGFEAPKELPSFPENCIYPCDNRMVQGGNGKDFMARAALELAQELMNAPAMPVENNSLASAAAIANKERPTSGSNKTPKA